MPVVLEHRPVVICQCYVPCHLPFREEQDGRWSTVGCLKYRGHRSPHGLEEEEKPKTIGPRIVLREQRDLEGHESGFYQGSCHMCGATYTMIALQEEQG